MSANQSPSWVQDLAPSRITCPHAECGSESEYRLDQVKQTIICQKCGRSFTVSTTTADASSGKVPVAVGIAPPPGAATELPNQINRYQIRQLLGQGGFGRVYLAYDPQLERTVALKVPRPGTLNTDKRVQRFLGDAKTAAQLRHPNIVPVFDAGQEGQDLYIASAYVPGPTLAEAIRGQTLGYRQAAEIVRSLAGALAYAHKHGIVHRDVKSENVILDMLGEPHLIDFGLARRGGAESSERAILGTPSYMSPEQAAGNSARATPASDQYSLGVVLYELLCGQTPFSGPPSIVLYHAVNTEPPAPRTLTPGIPPDLEFICLKALKKEPEQRYENCEQLAEDLRRWLDGEPPLVRKLTRRERFVRWVRREPKLAGALGTAATAIMLAAVVGITFGLIAWVLWKRAVESEGTAIAKATEARENEKHAIAGQAQHAFDHAFGLCEKGEIGQGMIWFAGSLQLAEDAGDEAKDLRQDIRMNLAGWRRHLHRFRDAYKLNGPIVSVTANDLGQLVVVGRQQDEPVQFRNPRATKTAATVPLLVPVDKDAQVLAWNSSRRVFLTAEGADVRLRHADTGQPLGKPLEHPAKVLVLAAAFSADGRLIATGCDNGVVYLWRLPTGEPITVHLPAETRLENVRELQHARGDKIRAVALHPRERFLLTGIGRDRTGAACRWNLETAESVDLSFPGDTPEVTSVALSQDGDRIAIACGSSFIGTVHLFQWDKPQIVPRLVRSFPHRAEVYATVFSPDGRFLATSGQGGYTRIWRSNSGEPVGQPLYHPRDVRALAFGSDSRQLATVCDDQVVRLWDLADDGPEREFPHVGPILTAAISPDGTRVFTGGVSALMHADRTWPLPGGPNGLTERIWTSAWSPDGRYVVAGGGNVGRGGMWIWDKNGQSLGPPLEHPDEVWSVAVHPSGHTLATGCADGKIRFWEIPTNGVPTETLPPITHSANDKVYALAFSPDGSRLISGGRGSKARLWDWASRKEIGEPLALPNVVLSAAFSRSSANTVLIGYAGGAELWRWEQVPARLAYFPHQAGLFNVALSDDGELALTGGTNDGTTSIAADTPGVVRLWRAHAARQLGPPWLDHGLGRAAAFAPHDTVFTAHTSRMRGQAHLWKRHAANEVDGDCRRIQAWAEVISGTSLNGDAAAVMSYEDWEMRRQQLDTALGGEPAIESIIADERIARTLAPRAAPSAPPPGPAARDDSPSPKAPGESGGVIAGALGVIIDRLPKPPDRAADKPRQRAEDIKPRGSGADIRKLIAGKWEVTKSDSGLPEGMVVEFTKDGKLTITIKNGDQEMTIEGTFKVNDDDLEITIKIREENTLLKGKCKMTQDEMTLTYQDRDFHFKRVRK